MSAKGTFILVVALHSLHLQFVGIVMMHCCIMIALYCLCSLSSFTMTYGFLVPQVRQWHPRVRHGRAALKNGGHNSMVPSMISRLAMTATFVPTNSTYLETPVIDANNDVLNRMDEISNEPPTLAQVRKLLPAQVFKVDTRVSLFYFAVDFIAVAATMGFLNQVVTSDVYHSLPWWNQAIMVAPLQVLTGFAMWCMWCIGMSSPHSLPPFVPSDMA